MKCGRKALLLGAMLLVMAVLTAIPFFRQFQQMNDGDSIVETVVVAGKMTVPWVLASLVLLCIAGVMVANQRLQVVGASGGTST